MIYFIYYVIPLCLILTVTGRSIPSSQNSTKLGHEHSHSHHHSSVSTLWNQLKDLVEEVIHPVTKPEFNQVEEICGTRPGFSDVQQSRIIGGFVSNFGDHPWQLFLHDIHLNIAVCGASLISSRTALTAAHCLEEKAENYLVFGGKLRAFKDFDEEPYQQVFRLNSYVLHPGFYVNENNRPFNDLAVMFITPNDGSRIKWSDWVRPACLPVPSAGYNLSLGNGLKGTISGYGHLGPELRNSKAFLRSAEVPVLSSEECHEIYAQVGAPNLIKNDNICAGEEGKDSCYGDSGGPLVVEDDNTGKFVLVGIISFGPPCGGRLPGICVRIDKYLPWIFTQMSKIENEQFSKIVDAKNPRSSAKKNTLLEACTILFSLILWKLF